MRLWREGGGEAGDTPSISITRCVLTREINCREEGKDGWRRRDGDGERRQPGREGEEERVKKEKEKKNHTGQRGERQNNSSRREMGGETQQNKKNATWKNESDAQEFGDG